MSATTTSAVESPGFGDLVPMALTPVRSKGGGEGKSKEPTPWNTYFEKVIGTQENATKTIDGYRSWMAKAVDSTEIGDLGKKWASIMKDIQTRWSDIFTQPEGMDYIHGFRALEMGSTVDVAVNDNENGSLFYLVPFLNFSITSNFATGKLFFNFMAALILGMFLSTSVCISRDGDEGFLMYQSLQSQVGDRFITKFFNWFTQHIANQSKDFNEWCGSVTISDSLFHLITNYQANESVLSHLGTVGYNQFTSLEPLPLPKAQRILDQLNGNHMMNLLKFKGGMTKLYSEILFQMGSNKTTCEVSEELVNLMGQDLLFYQLKTDPVERARLRNIWGIAILITVSEAKNNPFRPKYLKDDTAFYVYIAERTGAKVAQWFLSISLSLKDSRPTSAPSNDTTPPPRTNNKSADLRGEEDLQQQQQQKQPHQNKRRKND